jgi:hypothetical protein
MKETDTKLPKSIYAPPLRGALSVEKQYFNVITSREQSL